MAEPEDNLKFKLLNLFEFNANGKFAIIAAIIIVLIVIVAF